MGLYLGPIIAATFQNKKSAKKSPKNPGKPENSGNPQISETRKSQKPRKKKKQHARRNNKRKTYNSMEKRMIERAFNRNPLSWINNQQLPD